MKTRRFYINVPGIVEYELFHVHNMEEAVRFALWEHANGGIVEVIEREFGYHKRLIDTTYGSVNGR